MYDICHLLSNLALEFVTVLTVIITSRFQQYIFIFIKWTSAPITNTTKSNLKALFKVNCLHALKLHYLWNVAAYLKM